MLCLAMNLGKTFIDLITYHRDVAMILGLLVMVIVFRKPIWAVLKYIFGWPSREMDKLAAGLHAISYAISRPLDPISPGKPLASTDRLRDKPVADSSTTANPVADANTADQPDSPQA